VTPVDATNPGRIRSAAVSEAPDAFNPSPQTTGRRCRPGPA
jgi:hypothetical protein